MVWQCLVIWLQQTSFECSSASTLPFLSLSKYVNSINSIKAISHVPHPFLGGSHIEQKSQFLLVIAWVWYSGNMYNWKFMSFHPIKNQVFVWQVCKHALLSFQPTILTRFKCIQQRRPQVTYPIKSPTHLRFWIDKTSTKKMINQPLPCKVFMSCMWSRIIISWYRGLLCLAPCLIDHSLISCEEFDPLFFNFPLELPSKERFFLMRFRLSNNIAFRWGAFEAPST